MFTFAGSHKPLMGYYGSQKSGLTISKAKIDIGRNSRQIFRSLQFLEYDHSMTFALRSSLSKDFNALKTVEGYKKG